MVKVILKEGINRFYGKLKTDKGTIRTFIEPSTVYDVSDGFENFNQQVKFPGDSAVSDEFKNELIEADVVYKIETIKRPCCPKGTDEFIFQPFEQFNPAAYEEVEL